MTCQSLDRSLDAYIDGELLADAAGAIRVHLGDCSSCSARVADREALVRLVQALPYHDVPPRLRRQIAHTSVRAGLVRRLSALAAAALVVFAAGAAVLRVTMPSGPTADAIVDAHVRSLMANHLFEVRSTDQHTVKPWFGGKLDFAPPVADLASIGYPLVGGRVDSLDGHALAALVYQRRQHVINVFVAPERRAWWPRRSAATVRGFQIRRWSAQGMTFWAVSDLNEAELTAFARALGSS